MSIFDALRQAVNLRELAGRHADLRASGTRWKGSCPHPDHDDTDPSFYIFPDLRFQCFGCGWRGDVVDLWAGVRTIEPGIEAALDLAREYGVEMPEMDPAAREKARMYREREDAYMRQAIECYEALSRNPKVTNWWERRGFDSELQQRFLLGANKNGTAAVIPFWNRGRVHGLIHRKLEGQPKYSYPKAEKFAGGHKPLFVPGSIRAGAFLVEGIVDALAVAALEEGVVAVGGTRISFEQMRELRGMPGPLYVLPDADKAGYEAAREWTRELYPKALICPAGYAGEAEHA